MIVETAKGMRQIIPFNQLGDLEDPDIVDKDGVHEKLKFKVDNHDEVNKGSALPVYVAKNSEGRVYTATLDSNDVRVEAGEKPDPYAEQKKKSEDRNMFVEGKQTPDKFGKTDKELGFTEDEEFKIEEEDTKKGPKKK